MNLLTIFDITKKYSYPFSVLWALFFFYKAARYSNKSYLTLIIFILILSIFLSAVGQSIDSALQERPAFLEDLLRFLDKFANLWIISLIIYHYTMLKLFKGRSRRYPYKVFILIAGFLSISISLLTNFPFMRNHNADFLIVSIPGAIILMFISWKTRHFREEIKFGLYSILKGSATMLIKFSFVQALFFLFDWITIAFDINEECLPDSADCLVVNISQLILYQFWAWFVLHMNWKMVSRDENENPDSEASSTANSVRSTYYVPMNS